MADSQCRNLNAEKTSSLNGYDCGHPCEKQGNTITICSTPLLCSESKHYLAVVSVEIC